jgi:HK97 family phage portal protein
MVYGTLSTLTVKKEYKYHSSSERGKMPLFKRRSKGEPMKFSMLLKGVLDPIKSILLNEGNRANTSGVNAYKNIWNVFAPIDHIGTLVADLPVKQYEKVGGEEIEIEESQVKNLLFYKSNTLDTGTDFMKAMTVYYILSGDAYGWLIGSIENPLEIWPLMSQNTTAIQGESLNEPIKRYDYENEFNELERFPPEEILHIKTFNPCSRINGLSVIDVARSVLDSQVAGDDWNKDIMKNDGAAAGAWVVEAILQPDQLQTLKKSIMEANAEPQNKGEPVVYGGGMKYERYALSQRDAEWIESSKFAFRKVCAVLHYPTQLLNDGENSTYSNMDAALKHLHQNTVLPIANNIIDSYNHFFFPDGNTYFRVDRKNVPALQESTTELVNSLVNAYWMRWNEKREKMGLPPDDTELGEQYAIPVNLQLSDDMLIGDGNGEGEGV